MSPSEKALIPIIESYLDSMTSSESVVASFFISQAKLEQDLSAEKVSQDLHVSKATLTRFAQKCGFSGYREFVFSYQKSLSNQGQTVIYNRLTQNVLSDYEEILHKTYSILDEEQLQTVTDLIDQADRLYLYAKGSSALALQEMKTRFMRLGIVCEVISDNDMFIWNNLLLDANCLVIAASISGKTRVVLDALEKASQRGAKTVLMTTKNQGQAFFANQVLLLASRDHLSHGNQISPQFPLLVMIDCLFAHYLNRNKSEKEKHYQQTIISHEEDLK